MQAAVSQNGLALEYASPRSPFTPCNDLIVPVAFPSFSITQVDPSGRNAFHCRDSWGLHVWRLLPEVTREDRNSAGCPGAEP